MSAVDVESVSRTLEALLAREARRIVYHDKATGQDLVVSPPSAASPSGLLPAFVVFVNGRSKAQIIPVLRERLGRTRESELRTRIEEFLAVDGIHRVDNCPSLGAVERIVGGLLIRGAQRTAVRTWLTNRIHDTSDCRGVDVRCNKGLL